jgi:hypothetical protein
MHQPCLHSDICKSSQVGLHEVRKRFLLLMIAQVLVGKSIARVSGRSTTVFKRYQGKITCHHNEDGICG